MSKLIREATLRLGSAVAPLNVRGVPRLLYGARRFVRSSAPFTLQNGLRLPLVLDDYFESMMLWGKYQADLLVLISHLVKPASVVIDGGAHIGYFSLHLGRLLGVAGRVYAFEPDPRCFERLRLAVNLNNLIENVVPLDMALAAEDAPIDFFLSPQLGWSTATANSHLSGLTRTVVRGVALDSLVHQGSIPSQVSLVKLDLEGFEADALRGMRRLLLNSRPVVLFEVNLPMLESRGETFEGLASMIRSMDFELYLPDARPVLYGYPKVKLSKFVDALPSACFDLLAVPREGLSGISTLLDA